MYIVREYLRRDTGDSEETIYTTNLIPSSRTYDILATSTKIRETLGSEGHKTSSLRSSRFEVMGAGENGARERDTRGERERQPESPMKIVSRA